LKIKGIEAVKQTKELEDLIGTGEDGDAGIDKSRLMLTHRYYICQDKVEMKLEMIGVAGVRGGGKSNKRKESQKPRAFTSRKHGPPRH
jgi:hypothetical protein